MTYAISLALGTAKNHNVSHGIPESSFLGSDPKIAVDLVERGSAEGLSLRAVAAELGVKAPSLYRYFSDKEALELAVAEAVMSFMLARFRMARATNDPETKFRNVVDV